MPKADATSLRATMFVEVNGEPYRVTLPNERMGLLLQLAASLFDDGKLGLAPTVLFKFPPANDGVPIPVPAAPFGTNVPELLAAADALLRTAPPEPDWVEEVRELLGEAYRFQSTSPKAQENINAALELIDRHASGVPPVDHQTFPHQAPMPAKDEQK